MGRSDQLSAVRRRATLAVIIGRTGHPGDRRWPSHRGNSTTKVTGTRNPVSSSRMSWAGLSITDDAGAAVDALQVDDAGTDQFVHPQCSRRRRRAARPTACGRSALGGGPVGDALEVHEPRCCCCARLDDSATASGEEPCARSTRSARSVISVTYSSPRTPWARPMRPTSRRSARQSTKSTSTSTPSRVAAARTTVRMLCAVRPRRPITRPRSPWPTLHLELQTVAGPRRRRP